MTALLLMSHRVLYTRIGGGHHPSWLGRTIIRSILRAAIWSTVWHEMRLHPWLYMVVILLVIVTVAGMAFRWVAGRR